MAPLPGAVAPAVPSPAVAQVGPAEASQGGGGSALEIGAMATAAAVAPAKRNEVMSCFLMKVGYHPEITLKHLS